MLKAVSKLRKSLASKIKEIGEERSALRVPVRSLELVAPVLRRAPITPQYLALEKSDRGTLAIGRDSIYLYPTNVKPPWYQLELIFRNNNFSEIFIRGNEIFATHKKLGRLKVKVMDETFNPERLLMNLAIVTNTRLDLSKPYAEAELEGWRLYFKLPLISGEWELSATRVGNVPRLVQLAEPGLATALLLLVLKPSVVAIVGPNGSGKTTLLNSMLLELNRAFPSLRISVIEQVPELILPPSAQFSRSIARPGLSVTTLVRQAMRYERPDIVVIGELRSEEIWSWIEAGRLGVAALTTYHAPTVDIAIKSMAKLLEQHISGAKEEAVLSLVNVFVLMYKHIEKHKIIRGIKSVYIADKGTLIPVYEEGRLNITLNKLVGYVGERLLTGSYNETLKVVTKSLFN